MSEVDFLNRCRKSMSEVGGRSVGVGSRKKSVAPSSANIYILYSHTKKIFVAGEKVVVSQLEPWR